MPKKITKLTTAQKERFGEWTQKWTEIGLSTEPADFDKATEAALKAYELCNLNRPMVVLRMGSPYAATIGGALAWVMLKEMGKQVGSQVESQVWSQVGSQVGSAIYNDRGGSYWSGWCAYISFFRDVMGWDDPILERFRIDEDLAKSCGWVWWHENVLAISDRPLFISRDEEGRLHNEMRMAIEYRDGWGLCAWHGVVIPNEWLLSKKPTAKEALTWENVEQRRAACEIVGWANVLRELDARVIDINPNPQIGTLYEVDLQPTREREGG